MILRIPARMVQQFQYLYTDKNLRGLRAISELKKHTRWNAIIC